MDAIRHRPVVIGIAGGSGSGKTTVLEHIIASLGPGRVAVLDHDAYYRSLESIPPTRRGVVNFDHPDALDTDLLCIHIDRLLCGDAVEKPVYDFATHTRQEVTRRIDPRPVIIVEGILVLAEPSLTERMDIKIYVDAPDDVRLVRRIRRDIHERGRSIESVLAQYEESVRPMHIQFVEPSRQHADVIIPRGGHNHVAIDMVIARIHTLADLGDPASV